MDRLDLHAFLDGELKGEKSESIRQALKTSDLDQREADAITGLKQMLATKVEQPAHDLAWKKCVGRLDEVDKTRRVERVVSRFAPAFCGILFGVILATGLVRHRVEPGHVSTPSLARMAGSFAPMRPPKTLGFNEDRWLSGLISQSKLSTPDHLTVRGISNGQIDGIPVRCFSARDEKGDLTILVVREPLELEGMVPMAGHPNLLAGKLNNVNCVVEIGKDHTIFIVAQRTFDDLVAVSSQVTLR